MSDLRAIQIKIEEAQYKQFQDLAENEGLPVNIYIKQVLRKHLKNSSKGA